MVGPGCGSFSFAEEIGPQLPCRCYDNLRPVAGKFPDTGIIPFFLATYACELGNLGEARAWLVLAFRAPDNKELRTKALDEERLESFWRKIGAI